ncbi:MAG: hypothetical protein CFE24_06900 [Flavobacterium sp. BFFFF2]|nr:MAG: hypothetical protein CFE24_06900 [Flavobacterium sp. BFFFF2]
MVFRYLCKPIKRNVVVTKFKPNAEYIDTIYNTHGFLFGNFHYVRIHGYVNDTIWYRLRGDFNKRYLIHDVNITFSEGEHYNRKYGILQLNHYKATKGHLEIEHVISTF